MMMWRALLVGGALSVFTLPACHGSSGSTAAVPRPAVVRVTMLDDHYEFSTPVPSGRVVFVVYNAGHTVHGLDLFPLPPGVVSIVAQLHGSTRRIIAPYADTVPLFPGQRGTFAVDLHSASTYAMVSFIRDPRDGSSQALKGLAAQFTTTARRS